MKTLGRGLRALVRSPLRSGLLVGALGISIGLALIMITVNAAFSDRLDEIKAQVGSEVTVRPAGSFGGGFFRGAFGGQNSDVSALTSEEIDGIAGVDHVTAISRTITVPYTGDGLTASLQPRGGAGGGNFPGGGEFRFPVLVTGTDSPGSLSTVGLGDAEFIAGRTFENGEAAAAVAVLGANLAEANGLAVGDTFDMEGARVEVVGIFTTGTRFGDNALFLPLATAQGLFGREGEIDEAVVQADSVDNAQAVADGVRALLGEDVADVSTDQATFAGISAPISDAQSSSLIGMIAAIVASAAVILFSVGLVARQRIREIGVLKAIGASNWHVTAQFGVETIVLSLAAALIGALATFPLAQSVANGLVSDPAAPGGGGIAGQFGRGGGGQAVDGGFQAAGGGFQAAGGFLGNVDVAVSPEIFLFAIGIGLLLAVLASVIPAWYVSRVKPAEVLRYE